MIINRFELSVILFGKLENLRVKTSGFRLYVPEGSKKFAETSGSKYGHFEKNCAQIIKVLLPVRQKPCKTKCCLSTSRTVDQLTFRSFTNVMCQVKLVSSGWSFQ